MPMINVLEKPVAFGGGIVLPASKSMSLQSPLTDTKLPELLTLPLLQYAGMAAEPLVQPGDKVLKGQMIARPKGVISAPIHASSSGTVKEIADYEIPSPTHAKSLCIVIETDGEDRWFEERHELKNYTHVSPVAIQQQIMRCGVVGLGGAGFPSAMKLTPGLSLDIELLIVNAAECEPFISCDEALIRNHADEFIIGVDILAYAMQADICAIAIEENKIETIAVLRRLLSSRSASGIRLKLVPGLYPVGGERQLIKSITGLTVPADDLPVDIGVACYNAGTAFAAKKAIVDAEPLISRVITVTGPGIASPANKRVRIGTPINELIEQCGGYSEQFDHLIMGGPMMGMRLENDAVPVIKTSNCLLALDGAYAKTKQTERDCIHCNECVAVCPAGLQPWKLHQHSKVFNAEQLQGLRLFDCIECACCSYVCPSHIPLVERYRLAKIAIWEMRHKRFKSERNRHRYEAKLKREQRRQQEQRLRTAQTVQGFDSTAKQDLQDKKQEIAAAVARVRKKRKVEITNAQVD